MTLPTIDTEPRVLLLTDSDAFAGTENHMLDLAMGLSSLNASVIIGCPSNSAIQRRAQDLRIGVVTVPKRFFAARMFLKVRGLLKSGAINIVHAHNGVAHVLASGATLSAGTGSCIATHHFLAPKRTQRRGLSAVLFAGVHRWASSRTGHFIAISNAVAEACIGLNNGVDMTVIHNGISCDARACVDGDKLRLELSIPKGAPLVVSAARLEREKSLDTLISAIALVRADIPNVVCAIAGEGDEMERLQEMISELGLQPSVRMLGFRKDAQSIIKAADVFVLPSLCEPFGLTILEAMMAGKPVIATSAGGPLELMAEGVTGLFFPPGDSIALAAALRTLLGDAELAERIAKAGQQHALLKFDAGRMCEQTLSVYKAVLSASKSPYSDRIA